MRKWELLAMTWGEIALRHRAKHLFGTPHNNGDNNSESLKPSFDPQPPLFVGGETLFWNCHKLGSFVLSRCNVFISVQNWFMKIYRPANFFSVCCTCALKLKHVFWVVCLDFAHVKGIQGQILVFDHIILICQWLFFVIFFALIKKRLSEKKQETLKKKSLVYFVTKIASNVSIFFL